VHSVPCTETLIRSLSTLLERQSGEVLQGKRYQFRRLSHMFQTKKGPRVPKRLHRKAHIKRNRKACQYFPSINSQLIRADPDGNLGKALMSWKHNLF